MGRNLLLAALLAAAACKPATSEDPPPPPPPPVGDPPCALVSCGLSGSSCDPSDGLCHCGANGPTSCAADERCDAPAARCTKLPMPVCNPGSAWAAGNHAFVDRTADVGLIAAGVLGTRLAVGDIDGDGYADLLVRRGGNGADDFSTGGVRQTWLLHNDGTGHFSDVTVRSGMRQTRTSTLGRGRPGEVVAFADVDNDGDLDLYTGMSTGIDGALAGETSELLLNDGSGNFSLGPAGSALRRALDVDIVAAASFLDYDRDGFIDLFVGQHNYTPAGTGDLIFLGSHLYRGDGSGNFREVTSDVGLATLDWNNVASINQGLAHARTWSSVACDLNGDGSDEIMVASYGRAPNHLWQASRDDQGAVHYANRSVISGYAYDENQNYHDNENFKCYCVGHSSAADCANVLPPRIGCSAGGWSAAQDTEPFRNGGNSGTTVCADVDNDGDMDLMTTEITHWWAGQSADESELLLNSGEQDVRFTRPGKAVTGLTRMRNGVAWDQGDMTAAVFDFDNDGWPDIYVGASDYAGNHGLLYRQDTPGHFVAVPTADGIDHTRSHGIAVADFDHDGDLDVVLGHSLARCDATEPDNCYATAQVRYFENQLGASRNFVQLDLVGAAGSNRAAIGARVSLTAGGVTQTQEVGGGHGHYGMQQDRVLHFGLGTACEAQVEVRWPDAALSTQRFDLVAGYRYRVSQGSDPTPVIAP